MMSSTYSKQLRLNPARTHARLAPGSRFDHRSRFARLRCMKKATPAVSARRLAARRTREGQRYALAANLIIAGVEKESAGE